GSTLLQSSFALYPGGQQSFPRRVGQGSYEARTGAVENNTLGYMWSGTPMDAVYRLTFTFEHSGGTLELRFAGINLQGWPDEGWGLDNVQVRVASIEPPPDLVITSATAPASAAWGQPVPVSWKVTNASDKIARARWSDTVYLSRDTVLSADDVALVTRSLDAYSPLQPGAGYDVLATATVPVGSIAGSAYLLFVVDAGGSQVEISEANNIASVAINVRAADLIVPLITVPETALSGGKLSVGWRVTNAGEMRTVGSDTWTDRVTLSLDDVLGNADDIVLGTFTHTGGLEAGASYGRVEGISLAETLPAGSYWVFVQTNANRALPEDAAGRSNVGRSESQVNVSLAPVPNLVTTGVQLAGAAVSGRTASVTWTVANAGDADAAAPWTDRVYFSPDGTLVNAIRLADFVRETGLAPGAQYTRTETVQLPSRDDGYFYILVRTDVTGGVYERDVEADNQSISARLVLTHPDVTVTSASVTPAAVESGGAVTVSWIVRNTGTGPTPMGWSDRFYMSRDVVWSSDDLPIGSYRHQAAIQAGREQNFEAAVDLADGAIGNWYIIVWADAGNEIDERGAENNNRGAASPVLTVNLAPYADLAVSDVDAPALIVGDPVDLTVSYRVTNVGTGRGKVDAWVDRVWLSPDPVFGGSDRLVAEVPHIGFMDSGASYAVENLVVPLWPRAEGRFYLFVETDAGQDVFEYDDKGSNVAQAGHVVDVMHRLYADLVVDSVTAGPSGQNGQPIEVRWTVSNIGLGATDTSSWSDVVWFSSNADGSGRRNLATVDRIGAMAPGASYVRSTK
ncbi:MAG: CARDB domain-containing protein, partial [Verrucomicrobiia bacterium]